MNHDRDSLSLMLSFDSPNYICGRIELTYSFCVLIYRVLMEVRPKMNFFFNFKMIYSPKLSSN